MAAVARNGVTGSRGRIPWHIPEDLERFRSITSAPGSCVIMGRLTWESIPVSGGGRKLPGRNVLVLSRSAAAGAADSADTKNADAAARHSRAESPRFFPGLGAALEYARPRYRRICIAGGESVYREALPLAAALLITRVNAAPEGDRFFPLDLDNAPGWTLFREEARAGFSFTVWKRVHAPESDQE